MPQLYIPNGARWLYVVPNYPLYHPLILTKLKFLLKALQFGLKPNHP